MTQQINPDEPDAFERLADVRTWLQRQEDEDRERKRKAKEAAPVEKAGKAGKAGKS